MVCGVFYQDYIIRSMIKILRQYSLVSKICKLAERMASGFVIAVLCVCVFFQNTALAFEGKVPMGDLEPGAHDRPVQCDEQIHDGTSYIVCRAAPDADIRLFLNGEDEKPFKHFNVVNEKLAKDGERLVFAMNAGMYHQDRSAVGFYVEGWKTLKALNTNDGPGNFHLKPNGVFLVWAEDGSRGARVVESGEVSKQDYIQYATQSGPMLVIEGEIHPRFISGSDSRKRRNGVGVTSSGEAIFVLADTPVNFHDFAMFFRNELQTPNALFLDGTISRVYAPDLGRNDPGAAMGPIVGVVETIKEE